MSNEQHQDVLLTAEGLKKLEVELENLKTVRRKEVAGRIKQAIEFGDISENSEYEDAKNEQAFIEGSILDLDKKLRHAKVIDSAESAETVSVGSTVILEDVASGDKMEYAIVGSMEADPINAKISNESPVGKSILGKAVGAIVNVEAPMGVIEYKVLNIK
ncbi:MAG: transcription elongation factor GreA [Clostridiales bacterium]